MNYVKQDNMRQFFISILCRINKNLKERGQETITVLDRDLNKAVAQYCKCYPDDCVVLVG